jgi:hypothetical protein
VWVHLIIIKDIELYQIYAFVTFVFVFYKFFQHRKYKGKPFFERVEAGVKVNLKYGVGTLFSSCTVIAVDSVKRVQLAGNCISLFNNSGNAFDVWIDRKYLAVAVSEAKALFPAAEYIQIDD